MTEQNGKSKLNILITVFAVLLLIQATFIIVNRGGFVSNDITCETVNTMLETGTFYKMNALTGEAVEIPDRLKILVLPYIFAFVSKITGIMPNTVIFVIAPLVVLTLSYLAVFYLGKAIFTEKNNLWMYMVIVSCLNLFGAYGPGVWGFSLLYAGWQGTTVRMCILVPLCMGFALRKRYLHCLMCMALETVTVWTGWGIGYCFIITIVILCLNLMNIRAKAGNYGND